MPEETIVNNQRNQLFACVLVTVAAGGCGVEQPDGDPAVDEVTQDSIIEDFLDQMPNNLPIPNAYGFAATYADAGMVELDNAFFTPQGTNGRHCGTCHAPEVGWSTSGAMVTALFRKTGGTHPIFANNLDTDRPDADMSTVHARWRATTMLRQGKFARKVGLPATRDYDLVGVEDPFGVSTTTSLFWFRRPMPTANLRNHIVHWDSVMTVGHDLHAGLMKQARANVTAAQQGGPASDEVVGEIADYEGQISHAQLIVRGVGRLDVDGAHGGPEYAAGQPLVAGRFDLYDAWEHSGNPRRRQIWRGQELFNNVNPPSGRRCGGCHSAANIGVNVNGGLFDVGASSPDVAKRDMAVFTFQSRIDGKVVRTTDPGLGLRDGTFANLNKFKTPNLRGLAARAPYFHGGTADTLEDVVHHYEHALGFVFTRAEEADLVAFLRAL